MQSIYAMHLRVDSKSWMLPRLFNRIEATRQTTKFYKPMHLAEQRRETERERKRRSNPNWKSAGKKNNYAFNIFSFGGRERGNERKRQREWVFSAFDYWITKSRKKEYDKEGCQAGGRGGNGKWAVVLRSPVLPFFTFNEAQEFLLDNLLSAGQPKGKKPKEPAKHTEHTHRQTQPENKETKTCNRDTRREREREQERESVRALAETCAIIWLISASKFIESKCKIER